MSATTRDVPRAAERVRARRGLSSVRYGDRHCPTGSGSAAAPQVRAARGGSHPRRPARRLVDASATWRPGRAVGVPDGRGAVGWGSRPDRRSPTVSGSVAVARTKPLVASRRRRRVNPRGRSARTQRGDGEGGRVELGDTTSVGGRDCSAMPAYGDPRPGAARRDWRRTGPLERPGGSERVEDDGARPRGRRRADGDRGDGGGRRRGQEQARLGRDRRARRRPTAATGGPEATRGEPAAWYPGGITAHVAGGRCVRAADHRADCG